MEIILLIGMTSIVLITFGIIGAIGDWLFNCQDDPKKASHPAGNRMRCQIKRELNPKGVKEIYHLYNIKSMEVLQYERMDRCK